MRNLSGTVLYSVQLENLWVTPTLSVVQSRRHVSLENRGSPRILANNGDGERRHEQPTPNTVDLDPTLHHRIVWLPFFVLVGGASLTTDPLCGVSHYLTLEIEAHQLDLRT